MLHSVVSQKESFLHGKSAGVQKLQEHFNISAHDTGIRLAIVSTVGIATIAASINAGGLGILLFEGLRTMNIPKILWGSVLSAGMAVLLNAVLKKIEEVI